MRSSRGSSHGVLQILIVGIIKKSSYYPTDKALNYIIPHYSVSFDHTLCSDVHMTIILEC